MSNELVKKDALPVQSMGDIEHAGRILAQTGMLGVSNPAEGFIIAATCQQERMSYLEFRETYNIIHGTPSMKADAMLAKFNELGGVHKIKSRTPDLIEIELDYQGSKTMFSLSWDEAKEEPFPYRGKESAQLAELEKPFEQRQLKTKYTTPRSRMQMLWARCVSDAIRCVCPAANKGSYTKEEVEDFVEADGGNAEPVPASPQPQAVADIPVEQTAPTVVTEETPFDEPDYTICPVPSCEFTGVKWETLKTEDLEKALQLQNMGVEDGHKMVINQILEARKNG